MKYQLRGYRAYIVSNRKKGDATISFGTMLETLAEEALEEHPNQRNQDSEI